MRRFGFRVGFCPSGVPPTVSTVSLNAAASWLAMSFVPEMDDTLVEVDLVCASVTGAPIAADLQLQIFATSSSNLPDSGGSALLTATASALPTANNLCAWTGLSLAVTANTQYWAVVRNLNATPTTNFVGFRVGGANSGWPAEWGSTSTLGWHKRQTNDSGGAWATGVVAGVGGQRVVYSGGRADGAPVLNYVSSSSDTLHTSKETGVMLTSGSNAKLRVRAISFPMAKVGTPTGDVSAKLYIGGSLQATSSAVAAKQFATSFAYVPFVFPSTVVIDPATQFRVSTRNSQADSSANTYRLYEYTWDSSAASLALIPFSAQKTVWDGSAWSQSSGVLIPYAVYLDAENDFDALASGASAWVA